MVGENSDAINAITYGVKVPYKYGRENYAYLFAIPSSVERRCRGTPTTECSAFLLEEKRSVAGSNL
jgi:hypothetical protein